MRYISRYKNFGLLKTDDTFKYQFQAGELIVGSLTTATGAGNFIDDTGLVVLPNLAAETGLAKYGLNTLFWEAPELSVANSNATFTNGKVYKVLRGTITFGGKDYKPGSGRIYATSTAAFTGTGTAALDIPEEFYKPEHHDQRAQHYITNMLERGDEAQYDPTEWNASETAIGGVRPL